MDKNKSRRKYTKEFKDSILKRLDHPINETVASLHYFVPSPLYYVVLSVWIEHLKS